VNKSKKFEWSWYVAVVALMFAAGILTIFDGNSTDGLQWIAMAGLFGIVGAPR